VLNRDAQHLTLLEAVQNHTPQVVVVDEVGTKQVGGGWGINCTMSSHTISHTMS
jgi:hypothetical protein